MMHNSCLCVNQVSRQILCSPYLPENFPPLTRSPPLHLTTAKESYGECLELKREYNQNCFILPTCYLFNGNSCRNFIQPSWASSCLFVFLGCVIYLLILLHVLFYLGPLSHFHSYFDAGVTNLNEPPSSILLPSHYWELGAGSIPFTAIENKKAMQHEGVIYVAGHPLLNRRCTNSQCVMCIRLRNDLHCVGYGVKLYSL